MLFRARESSQVRDELLDMLKRRLLVFLEIEAEPAGGEAAVALGLFACDQRRQLERLGDRHPADLSRGHLGEDEVVVFQRPPEDRSRMALRGRRCSSPGPSGVVSLERGNLRQRADLVQALFPSSYGQGPSVSPCARWAGTACWSTMIVTDGFVADSVRWQITTLCPY
jgi:hypothetical protein